MLSDDWDQTEIEMLKDGLKARESYRVIGKRIGRSRNAVCAKVHRLGLGIGKDPAQPQQPARPKMPSLPPSADTMRILARHRAEAAVRTLVSLTDLGESQCHFPVGDPKVDRAIYCGEPSVPGLQYCASCVSRMYQPPEMRRVAATTRSKVSLVTA